MPEKKVAYSISRYDVRHDVMNVYLKSQQEAFADEEQKDFFIFRNDTSNEIVGFTIIDFSKNLGRLKKLYPQYEFPQVAGQIA